MFWSKNIPSKSNRGLLVLLLLGLSGFWSVGLAQPEELEQKSAEGKARLELGEFEQALELFAEGLRMAENDRLWQSRFNFYLALTFQTMGDRAEGRSEAYYRRAIHRYQLVLETQPDSTATMNNLARVYEALGDHTAAARLFRRAIEANDERKSIYQMNYADLLMKRGEWESAAPIYEEVSKDNPQNATPHRTLIDQSVEQADAEGLARHLWSTLRAGQVLWAQAGAVQALLAREWTQAITEELLTIVAMSLARQTYDPRTFVDGEASRSVRSLLDSPYRPVPRASEGLLSIHNLRALDPDFFSWWRRGDSRADPERGVWPSDGFRELVRSLGSRYQQIGNMEAAEAYYRLAADFNPEEPDALAFRQLVNLRIQQGRSDQVSALAEEYEDVLLRAKGQAYRASQVRKIFEYHQTLGELYGYLGRWGDQSTVTSAIFQLDRARSLARDFKTEAPGSELVFSPELTNLLATGYERTGQPQKSVEVRLEEAEGFERSGNTNAVQKVIQPIDATVLTPRDQNRFERLKEKTPNRTDRDVSAGSRETVEERRVSPAPSPSLFRPPASRELTVVLGKSDPALRLPEEVTQELENVVKRLLTSSERSQPLAQALDCCQRWGRVTGVSFDGRNSGRIVLERSGQSFRVDFKVQAPAGMKLRELNVRRGTVTPNR